MADTWTMLSGYTASNYVDTMVFEVVSATKKIRPLSGQTLVAGEKNSQYVRFEMDRFWDGIDISAKNFSITYSLAGKYYGTSEAVSAEVSTDKLRFGWIVPEEACCIAGTLMFVLVIKSDGYVLKTQIAETPVVKSLDEESVVPEPTREAWYKEFQASVQEDLNASQAALTSAQDALTRANTANDAASSALTAASEANLAAQDAIVVAKERYGSPLVANAGPEMVETNRVYVFTGSESAYTYGHWYYYDNGVWNDGGVYNGEGVATDKTLSVENMPADAKATGDKIDDEIGALKEDLNAMNTASASDVGKALKAKIVTNGKVTEWEFGDTDPPDNIVCAESEYEATTLIDHATAGKAIQNRSVNLTQGQTAIITVTTESNGLTLQLTKNGTIVQTIIENNSHVATTDEVFEFVVEADADKLRSWSNGNNTITLQTKELVSVTLVDKDGEELPTLSKYATKSEFDSAVTTLTSDVNGKIGITGKTVNWDTLLSKATSGGTKNYPCNISAGTHLYITVTTNGGGLALKLLDGETIIDTIIDDSSHVATADEHFEWVATADCDTFQLWTKSTFTLSVQTKASVSGTVIDTDGQMIVINANQVGNLEATRNYELEAKLMRFPHFVSGLYIDIARKYFTKLNLLTILDEMADAGMNTIFFHFSENEGFRFGLDDMTIHANGTTYDLSVSLGKGNHAYGEPEDNDNYITQSEMTELISYAKSLGIEVVPSFDMPSHMGCILKDFSDFWSNKVSSHTITLSNPLAVNFAYAVLEKYIDYFQSQGCGYWCLGADEVHGYTFSTDAVSAGLFVDFCNTAIKKIIRHGMLPLMFNDNIGTTNIYDKINKGVIVLYWRKKNDIGAQSIADMGYRVFNMSDTLYYVAGGTGSLDPSSFNVFRIGSGNPIDAPVGGNISIWNDNAGGIASANDGGDAAVADTAQYISDFGAVMKTQKKNITVLALESVTVQAGGIGIIPVTLTGTYSLKTLLNAYVTTMPSLKYIGFRNVSCETDPIDGSIKSGTINIYMVNTGDSAVSLNTSNSVGIDFL